MKTLTQKDKKDEIAVRVSDEIWDKIKRTLNKGISPKVKERERSVKLVWSAIKSS